MRNDFRIIYRKSFHTPIPTTCWQVKPSICLTNMGWLPDLCTSARAKCVPMLFGGLHKSTWQCLSSYLEISLETRTIQPVISRYVEYEELRSKGKYTRQYPYVIGLFKICIITAHAHAVDTRPSLPPPLEGLGTRLIHVIICNRQLGCCWYYYLHRVLWSIQLPHTYGKHHITQVHITTVTI